MNCPRTTTSPRACPTCRTVFCYGDDMEIAKISGAGIPFKEAEELVRLQYTSVDTVAAYLAAIYADHGEISLSEVAYRTGLEEDILKSLITDANFNDLVDAQLASLLYTPRDRASHIRELIDAATNKDIKSVETREYEAIAKGGKVVKLKEVREKVEKRNIKEVIMASEQLEVKQARARKLPKHIAPVSDDRIVFEGYSPEEAKRMALENIDDADFKVLPEQLTETIERRSDYEDYAQRRRDAREKLRKARGVFDTDPSALPPTHILRRGGKVPEGEQAKADDFFTGGYRSQDEGTSPVEQLEEENRASKRLGVSPQHVQEQQVSYKTQMKRTEMEQGDYQKDKVGGIYGVSKQKALISGQELREELQKRAEARRKWVEDSKKPPE